MKANWAVKKLEELDRGVVEWFKNGAHYTHRIDVDPDDPSRCLLKISADQIPISPLSLAIGDIIQNIRSSLDHVAYSLASAYTQPLQDQSAHNSQFPIIGDENRRGVAGQGPTIFQQNATRSLSCVDPAARSFIEGVQPYHRGSNFKKHPLWQLQYLSNVDKHRVLHIGAAYAASYTVTACTVSGVFDNQPGIVTQDTIVAHLGSVTPIDPSASTEMQVVPNMTVAFADGELCNHFVVDTLASIVQFVGQDVLTPLTQQFL